jgi:hypothetical protein
MTQKVACLSYAHSNLPNKRMAARKDPLLRAQGLGAHASEAVVGHGSLGSRYLVYRHAAASNVLAIGYSNAACSNFCGGWAWQGKVNAGCGLMVSIQCFQPLSYTYEQVFTATRTIKGLQMAIRSVNTV